MTDGVTDEPQSDSVVGQSGVLRFLLGAATVGIVLLVLERFATVLTPFLQAGFIAVIAGQPMSWVRKRLRIPHSLAAILVGVGLTLAFVLLAIFLTMRVREVGSQYTRYEARIDAWLKTAEVQLNRMGVNAPVSELDSAIEPRAILGAAATVAGETGEVVTRAFFVVIIVVFLLIEAPRFGQRLERIMGSSSAVSEFERFSKTMNRYLVIKCWVSFGTGATAGLLLALIGVEYPLLWGLIAFVLNFIPTIGSLVAAVPPVVLAFLTMSWVEGLLAIGAFLVANLTFGNILEPRFLGSGLGISVPLILLSLGVWGWVFGLTGAFLAVPLTMTVLFVLAQREDTRPLVELVAPGASQLGDQG